MNDRELLELAAKAAGYVVRWYEDTLTHGPTFGIEVEPGNPCGFEPWNPLTDDGDALRLAVKLKLSLLQHPDGMDVTVVSPPATGCRPLSEQQTLGREEGLRRAIVRAAAEIGKAMS